MGGKPPVHIEPGILKLPVRLRVHVSAARRGVIAIPAVVLVRRPNELSFDDQVPQIAQHLSDHRARWRFDPHVLLASLTAREVIHATFDLRTLEPRLEHLDGSEPVKRVLKTAAAVERALPAVAPVSAGLVIEDFERRGADLVDAIDAAGDTKCDSLTEIDLDGFRSRERLRFVIVQRT